MNVDALVELYRHMEWADAAVWKAVLASDAGRADAEVQRLFHHLHVVQRAFLRAWRGEPRAAPYPTFEEAEPLMQWGRSYYPEAFAYLGAVADARLADPMPLPWANAMARQLGHAPAATTLGETMLQVTLHSLYHRGQINARLRQAGGEPPLVDYIAWLWSGRPAPAWPAAP